MKRMATGGPVPSPTVKTEPRAVVNRKVPRRTNRLSNNSSSRSIGRPHLRVFRPGRSRPPGGRSAEPAEYRCADVLLDQNPSFPAMRGQALATASLSRNYGLKTGFGFDRRQLRRAWRLSLSENEASDPAKSLCCCAALGGRAVAMAAIRRPSRRIRRRRRKAPRAARISAPSRRPQLFASDCTGAGCHKGPQGLGKRPGSGRPRELPARALHQQPRKRGGAGRLSVEDPERAASRGAAHAAAGQARGHGDRARVGPAELGRGRRGEQAGAERSAPAAPRSPAARTSRAAARPDEDPAATPPAAAGRRAAGGRAAILRHAHSAAVSRPPPAAAPAPPPPPEPEAAPAPPPPPPPPPPKQFDIFD